MQQPAAGRQLRVRGDAAGQGSQIDDQAAGGKAGQLRSAEHRRGDSVENELERTEPSGKAAGVERAHAIGLDPGEIPRGTGGNRDGGIQRVQLMGEQRADTPISDDQAGRALQGMLGLLHSEL